MNKLGSVYGKKIKTTIFGESHGPSIGLVIDGLPPGICVDCEYINDELKRRRPGKNEFSSPRQEQDEFFIQSGVFEGRTTGTPLAVIIPNSDSHSKDYSILKHKMRPGHADYAGIIKYKAYNDYRGGGHFSGRLTAPMVFVGALAKLALRSYDITIGAHISSIGKTCDRKFNPLGETKETLFGLKNTEFAVLDKQQGEKMQAEILAVKKIGDSIGGSVECMAIGLPVGVGEPFFDSLESSLAHVIFSIPAVKGLEFGLGFDFTQTKGSNANDKFYYTEENEIKTKTNNNGGILGGITNGMPVVFNVAFKATPSIALPQETVNLLDKENTVLEIRGRHDPCIVQRAVPVIEAAAAWTILDLLLTSDLDRKV